jgi:PAS domain S-box-containing protein
MPILESAYYSSKLRTTRGIALLGFICGITLTLLGVFLAREKSEIEDRAYLEAVTGDLVKGLEDRISLYTRGLEGTRGMVNALGVGNLDYGRFKLYGAARSIKSEFPGSRGIGFIQRVPAAMVNDFVARERLNGQPAFAVREIEPNDGDRMIIRFIYPEEGNERAAGLDIASEKNRREAAILSGASGQPVLTGPISLVQANQKKYGGMLFLMPVYSTYPIPQDHQKRQEALLGWSYMPLVIDEILENLAAPIRLIEFKVVDHANDIEIYRSASIGDDIDAKLAAGIGTQKKTVEVFGREWNITAAPSPQFYAERAHLAPAWIILAGGAFSLLGALSFYSVARGRLMRRASEEEAQNVRQANEKNWKLLANSLPTIVWTADEAGAFDFISEQWRDYDKSGDDGGAVADWLSAAHPEDRPFLAERWREAVRNATLFEAECRLQRSDGTYRWFFARAVRVVNDEKIVRWHGSLNDIEDWKAVELRISSLVADQEEMIERRTHDLNVARHDLRSILDAIPSMIGYWNKDLTNRFANRAYKSWFGVEGEEIVGRHIKDLLGEKIFAKDYPFMKAALEGTHQKFERELPMADGRISQVQAHYLPDMRDNEILGFFILVFDITDLKDAEKALIEAKGVAEDATKAKSLFLTSMSHELRTPMNGILGFADLLSAEVFGPLNEKQREFCGYIKTSGEHLLSLMEDVLELSKVEAGKVSIEVEPTDVGTVIAAVTATLEPTAKKNGITVENEAKKVALPMVLADITRLNQCLINLGSNAIKYNRVGGHVRFCAEKIGSSKLRLYVRDTGHGIAEGNKSDIFMPFNRLGAERSNVEGTGIGLTLTKKLVEAMGGEIDFSSELGVGSSFWIDLPISLSSESTKDVAMTSDGRADIPQIDRKICVLYVEDNEQNVVLMRNYLSLLKNVELVIANDGRQGLEAAIAQKPDLIILDINLPEMSGAEVLMELRAKPAFDATPIVALTANAMKDGSQRALSAGFDSYLTKPARLNDIMNLLANVAGGSIEIMGGGRK